MSTNMDEEPVLHSDGVNAPPVTPNPAPNVTTLSTTTTAYPIGPKCDQIQINYSIAPAIICAMCFIFGILYTFFGESLLYFFVLSIYLPGVVM